MQEYLKKYGAFINKTTLLAGVYVYQVNAEFYAEVNLQELDRQLQIMVGIVYLKEAVRATVSETYKECLKKVAEEKWDIYRGTVKSFVNRMESQYANT